jgi:hypothetical protein
MTVWVYWIAASFVLFMVLELHALHADRPTLSRTVWYAQARFPLLSFMCGIAVGGLAMHFFGWNPSCNQIP